MVPSELRAESFVRYPQQARSFAVSNLPALRRMPLILASLMLRQVIQFDWCFPAEREQLSRQFDLLSGLDAASFDALMTPFSTIVLSAELRGAEWVDRPQLFSEQLTAYLWSEHQIDRYHEAAQDYQQYLETALKPMMPAGPRWTIVTLGQGSEQTERSLFRKLLPHGTLFTQVDPVGGLEILLAEVRSRAQRYPTEYAHWYIEGGAPHAAVGGATNLTTMSYDRLVPATRREFSLLKQFVSRQNSTEPVGVEAVSSYVASLSPEDLDLKGSAEDAVLRHFEVNVLTQGAGCQIYSTTFVQWAARECLHRAQPLTLFARFSPRQVNAPMEQLLVRDPLQQPQDHEGSLVDADMGAYYTWINQSRLAGAEQSRFLVWFEGHRIACAIAPTLSRGTTSASATNLRQVLDWMA
ncbi:hypothetical protein FTO74_09650 [Granulicella sp. WH15]|uniref:hypothetical protein n=1 Tax=Granulicella sp. WH15 TaxID=2602070 RepID=UPI0013679911|nr:hypothetical protein [Granulicella sp. WH15]QHN03604.1 hypothetical protein FTO74_09650 [Granulicella sp. WH15]